MSDDTCRLTLLLPPTLGGLIPPGVQHPCLMGCLLTVSSGGVMTITGPSRAKVFEQADRFFRILIRRNPPPPLSIAATLTSPCGVRDGWQVIINAEISFAPTSIEATVFAASNEDAKSDDAGPEVENSTNVVRLIDGEARKA